VTKKWPDAHVSRLAGMAGKEEHPNIFIPQIAGSYRGSYFSGWRGHG